MNRSTEFSPGSIVLSIVIAGAAALPTHGFAGEPDFAAAVQQYRSGRMSDAYGRFIRLADAGDPDAARIALFMHKFGPVLYGTYWDANPEDMAYWTHLASKASSRPDPAFRPGDFVRVDARSRLKSKSPGTKRAGG